MVRLMVRKYNHCKGRFAQRNAAALHLTPPVHPLDVSNPPPYCRGSTVISPGHILAAALQAAPRRWTSRASP